MSTLPSIDKFIVKPYDKEISVDRIRCEQNFTYWQTIPEIGTQAESEILTYSDEILPAHTFAYHYRDKVTGKRHYPIENIFGYDRRTGKFNPKTEGLKAQAFRNLAYIPDLHMDTSKKLGHNIFLFAYHGAHNPYHRLEDFKPVRPFGVFIKRECEHFGYCHGTPCDIAEANPEVNRSQLEKYYLLPEHLRALKANQVCNDQSLNKDFWYYYGNPEVWRSQTDYGKNIYRRTGEFRYYGSIKPDSIAAILWPHFTDVVMEDNTPDMDANFDFINAFRKAFRHIQIIEYNHDVEDEYNWESTLVEASYLSTKFHIEKGYFPSNIQALKKT